MNKIINVCFLCDKGYVIPTMVAISSLKINRNSEYLYKIYVIVVDIDEINIDLFLKMSGKNFIIQTIRINNEDIDKYKDSTQGAICVATTSALLKFKLPR